MKPSRASIVLMSALAFAGAANGETLNLNCDWQFRRDCDETWRWVAKSRIGEIFAHYPIGYNAPPPDLIQLQRLREVVPITHTYKEAV